MGARGAVVLGRLGCGAVLVGQRDQAQNLAGRWAVVVALDAFTAARPADSASDLCCATSGGT